PSSRAQSHVTREFDGARALLHAAGMKRRIALASLLFLMVATSACSGSSSGTHDGGLGGWDGGGTGDGGDGGGPGDGGDAGDGGEDPLAGLDPIDPACADGKGAAETCWDEWLKRVGDTKFTPVQR